MKNNLYRQKYGMKWRKIWQDVEKTFTNEKMDAGRDVIKTASNPMARLVISLYTGKAIPK